MQMGVCCCVSYSRTESCVATAYTIRYGKEKTGLGAVDVSRFRALEVDVFVSPEAGGGGGGSMTEEAAGDALVNGSGREGIGSSGDEVSMVMCFVTGGDCLKV